MSMKVTGEKGNKKIAINATTTQCNVIEKTQEISDDDDDDEEDDSKKKESVLLNISQCLTK